MSISIVTDNEIPEVYRPNNEGILNQPDRNEIVICTDLECMMPKSTFDNLLDYTGAIGFKLQRDIIPFIGKMWKRCQFLDKRKGSKWILCWMSKDDDPKYIKINERYIIIQ